MGSCREGGTYQELKLLLKEKMEEQVPNKEKDTNTINDDVDMDDKEDTKKEANLGDVIGAMGFLASAFAPAEQQGEIQQQFNQLGQMLGGQDFLKANAYTWEKMEEAVLPKNALPAGRDGNE